MGRCECGDILITATLQPHQKSSGILLFVCSKSFLLPSECSERTKVVLKRVPFLPSETYEIWVRKTRLGAVGVLPIGGWIWMEDDKGHPEKNTKHGVRPTKDDAVRELLRETEL